MYFFKAYLGGKERVEAERSQCKRTGESLVQERGWEGRYLPKWVMGGELRGDLCVLD